MVELELDTRLGINEIASSLICLKLLIYLSSYLPLARPAGAGGDAREIHRETVL